MDDSLQIRIRPLTPAPERKKLPAPLQDYPSGVPAAFIGESILQELKEYAASDLNCELGGVLVGTVGKSRKRIFVEIEGFIPARKGISRKASFEFTNEAQQDIHEIMQSRFPDRRIIGWFHTHPGYGIFLSSMDQFIDEHYFNQDYHIAVVIDPGRKEIEVGAFVWDDRHRRKRVPLIST